MKHYFFILLILVLLCSCGKKEEPEMTIISGVIHSLDSKKVYLSKIDHFDYMNNGYIIDSSEISKTGKFEFQPHNLESNLVSVTTANFKPFTLQILNDAPQTYFFGNCEKFFTTNPTFYVEKNENINFEWFKNSNIDSIGNPNNSKSVSKQIELRNFYLSSKKIDSSTLDLDIQTEIQENWKQLVNEREYDIRKADLKHINATYSFDNYIYTEIYLGGLNYFLSWFEEFHPEEVNFAIQNPDMKTVYSALFSEYIEHDWNPKSFEYYKFTERYINHFMNIDSGVFQNYHKPTAEKQRIAKQVLSGENKKRYLLLMRKQFKEVL